MAVVVSTKQRIENRQRPRLSLVARDPTAFDADRYRRKLKPDGCNARDRRFLAILDHICGRSYFVPEILEATPLNVVEKLLVYPENMMANLNKFRGLVHSQRVLLALTQAGVSREDAYRLVQRNAMKVWEEGKDFLEELLADTEVRAALSEAEIRDKFNLDYHTRHVDTIFRRVFG